MMNSCAIISALANAVQLFEHPTAQGGLISIECALHGHNLCALTLELRREVYIFDLMRITSPLSLRFDRQMAQGSLFAIECTLQCQ